MAKDVRSILEAAFSAVEGKDEGGMVYFESMMVDLLVYHVEDLSVFESAFHAGGVAWISEQLIALGRMLFSKKPADLSVEEWGRQLRNALGAIWKAQKPRKENGKTLLFLGTAWWATVKRVAATKDQQALGVRGEGGELPGGLPARRGRRCRLSEHIARIVGKVRHQL